MNCRQARRLCSNNGDQSLSERKRTAMQSHLSACQDCRRAEQDYREFVIALQSLPGEEPRRDLLAQARQMARVSPETSGWFKWRVIASLGRNAIAAAVVVSLLAGVLIVLRPRTALGQTVLRKLQASLSRARTMHHVAWLYLPDEKEARSSTWHDGKKPLRTETWLTREAMSGTDELLGPYLWTDNGYLSYDSNLKKVTNNKKIGIGSPKEAIQSAFNPISELQKSVPAGNYLSVKQLGGAVWRGVKVVKLQIASGPTKPSPEEEVPSVQEPGSTPPLSAGPSVRETFWVDKETDLPVYSEYEKQIQQRWVLQRRSEYDYNRPAPPEQFDPVAVRKAAEVFAAARQKKR